MCVRCVLHVGVIAETEGGRASEGGRANKKRNGMGRSFEIGGGGGSGPSERDRREDGDCDCMRGRQMEGDRCARENGDSRQRSMAVQKTEIGWSRGGKGRIGARSENEGTDRRHRAPLLRTTTTRNVAPVSLRLCRMIRRKFDSDLRKSDETK